MYEKKQGKKSFWYPYIRELDRQAGRGQLAVESPLLWSESELAYLTGSRTKVSFVGFLLTFVKCLLAAICTQVLSSEFVLYLIIQYNLTQHYGCDESG